MDNRKILFSDLDGTLLTDKKKISKKNIEAIQQLLHEGHYFVVATGGPVASGRKVVKKLGLTKPGCYMIAFNGAVLYDCAADRILLKRSLPIEYVQELFERAEKENIYAQTYLDSDIVTPGHTKELDFYMKNSGMRTYKLSKKIYDVLEEEPQKVLLISLDDEKKLETFQKDNMKWEKGKCSSFFSSSEYLEYCPMGVSKGFGMEYLAQLLNIPFANTIAVGDERNDIPMIQTANIGVAMANAKEEVKLAADYVTIQNNNEDAIAEIIEKFVLNQDV